MRFSLLLLPLPLALWCCSAPGATTPPCCCCSTPAPPTRGDPGAAPLPLPPLAPVNDPLPADRRSRSNTPAIDPLLPPAVPGAVPAPPPAAGARGLAGDTGRGWEGGGKAALLLEEWLGVLWELARWRAVERGSWSGAYLGVWSSYARAPPVPSAYLVTIWLNAQTGVDMSSWVRGDCGGGDGGGAWDVCLGSWSGVSGDGRAETQRG